MQTNAKNIDLTIGAIWQAMFKFALPIFLGTLFQSLYTIVDAIIIGQFAGKSALAAIEAVLPLTRLPVNFFVGVSSGATIIIAQYYGAKKFKVLSDASHNAMLFSAVGGLILSIIGIIVAPTAIELLKVPTEIAGDARLYIIIYYGVLAISMIYNMGAGILRALGDSKSPFYFLIAANIFNIVLDLVFVSLFGWGVVGAAVATALATVLSAVLVIIVLVKTNLPCKLYFSKLKFYKIYLLEIFRLGLPIGIQGILYPIANGVVQSSINSFGVNSIAAWAIAGKLDFLVWNISSAFSFAVSTFVAQNIGAQKYQRTRSGVRAGLTMAIAIILVISVLLYFFSMYLARFLVTDSAVIALNTTVIRFFAPFYFVYTICTVLSGALRGTGDTFSPMAIDVAGILVFRIAWVLLILPLSPSLLNALACMPLSWIITSLVFIILYNYKIKQLTKYANIQKTTR